MPIYLINFMGTYDTLNRLPIMFNFIIFIIIFFQSSFSCGFYLIVSNWFSIAYLLFEFGIGMILMVNILMLGQCIFYLLHCKGGLCIFCRCIFCWFNCDFCSSCCQRKVIQNQILLFSRGGSLKIPFVNDQWVTVLNQFF